MLTPAGPGRSFTGDHLNDFIWAGGGSRNIARHPPLADHDDALRHLERLGDDVGDDDDADALGGDALDHLEPPPGLLDAERGKGLVQQHELAAPMDEAVELDRLSLSRPRDARH